MTRSLIRRSFVPATLTVPQFVLLLIATGLMVAEMSPTARAQGRYGGKKVTLNTKLVPPIGGDEPKASGSAKLQGTVRYWQTWFGSGWGVSGTLTVTCQGLTPYATYATSAGAFMADPDGKGTATGFYSGWYPPTAPISVAREVILPDGTATYVLVLQGEF